MVEVGRPLLQRKRERARDSVFGIVFLSFFSGHNRRLHLENMLGDIFQGLLVEIKHMAGAGGGWFKDRAAGEETDQELRMSPSLLVSFDT